MVFLRTLRSHHFYTFLRHQNTSLFVQTPPHSFPKVHECVPRVSSFLPSSIFQRTFSVTAQLVSSDVTEKRTETESTDSENNESTKAMRKLRNNKKGKKGMKGKKPLDVMFKEAVGINEKREESETSEEESGDSRLKEIKELKKKLRKLEREVSSVKGNVKVGEKKKKMPTKEEQVPTVQSKPTSLYSLFVKNSDGEKKSDPSEGEKVYTAVVSKPLKELSPELVSLVSRLHEEGYLNNANFLPPKKLDLSCFSNHYSRDFIRFAAELFGRDHQEIAKWLSGGDLKQVALFGCPSVERKTAFSAKRLRSFFSIQEDTVCRPCKLKSSCKFVNQRVREKVDNLNLADVMRVLTLYAAESVPAQLAIPNEIKASVSKLFKEVLNLSQDGTVSGGP